MIMKDLHRNLQLDFHVGKGVADEFFQRLALIIDVHPHKAAVRHFALYLSQSDIGFSDPIAVACLLARNVGAIAVTVELPMVKDACDALSIAGGMPENRVIAMRARVVKTSDATVVAAHDGDAFSARVGKKAIIVSLLDFAFMAGDQPNPVEDLVDFLFEDGFVQSGAVRLKWRVFS